MWDSVLSLQEQVTFLRDHFGSELRELRLRVTELEKARLAGCRKEEDIEKSLSMERVGSLKPLEGLMSSNYFIDTDALTLSEKIQQNTFLSG